LTSLARAGLRDQVMHVNSGIPESGLYGAAKPVGDGSKVPWRLSPEPVSISEADARTLQELGQHLYRFTEASNRLYLDSVRGNQPGWIAGLLDKGKSEQVIELGRLNRLRSRLPVVIRPDLMAVGDGEFVATELDSVPGGIGLLDALTVRYRDIGHEILGNECGLVLEMARALVAESGQDDPFVAVVVSDESEMYRAEMNWVGERLNQFGVRAVTVHPRQIDLEGGSIVARLDDQVEKVHVIYRFFELHDLKNIPNVDLMLHAMKRKRVVMTPPPKPQLEEKMMMAFFHHPELAEFWARELGEESLAVLRRTLPPTWIVDPTQMPAFAAISPEFQTANRTIRRWDDLLDMTQKQRRLVLKPSGFSELAWGARGVTIGHDVKIEEWNEAVQTALSGFDAGPYIVQHYHASQAMPARYYDFDDEEVKEFTARARYSPYYFVQNGEARLAGVLATACPVSSKVLHGMPDAVMAPVQVDRS